MHVKRSGFLIQTNPLMLRSETMSAYCQKPTQLCGWAEYECLMLTLEVHQVSNGNSTVKL